MIVVSDTSPITNLMAIGKVDLLRDLFDSVRVPPRVNTELREHHAELPEFVTVTAVTNVDRAASDAAGLDPGEAEAIALAVELNPDYLLIDETLGRSFARQHGVPVIGLLGVLLMAKQDGLIESVAATMDQLTSQAGFYVADNVRKRTVEMAGESDMNGGEENHAGP